MVLFHLELTADERRLLDDGGDGENIETGSELGTLSQDW